MTNETESRGCIAPIVYIFLISWLCYGLFFGIGLWLTRALVWQYVIVFAALVAAITSLAVRANLRHVTPTTGMLVRRVKISDVEQQFAENPGWQALKTQLQAGDEIWLWAAFGYGWMSLGGRYGYVIVRDGKTTDYFMIVQAAISSQ